MKILFIAPLPPPITGHSLAAKIFFEDMIKDHQVKVVNLSKDSLKQGLNSIARIIQVFKIIKEIRNNQKDADAVYLTISESLFGNVKDLLIYLICFHRLSRMVIHLHGGSIKKQLFDQNKLVFALNKYFLRRLGGAIVLGKSHVHIFSDIIPVKKIYIVPNFAEDYLFISEKEIKEKFAHAAPLRVLFVSNLIAGKGQDELVDAYLALTDKSRKKMEIDFAGAFESDIQKVKFLNRIDGINGISYHGIVEDDRKKDLFSRAHIFCLPTSLSEGQPISILEAYASGCAVLTTNQGGISDIFRDKINGYEIEKGSAKSIKSVIERMSENPEPLLRMAMSNREIAHIQYRTSHYNASLKSIIENIGSGSNNQQ